MCQLQPQYQLLQLHLKNISNPMNLNSKLLKQTRKREIIFEQACKKTSKGQRERRGWEGVREGKTKKEGVKEKLAEVDVRELSWSTEMEDNDEEMDLEEDEEIETENDMMEETLEN
ncbi:hypothetical protein L873DRAFT_1846060 [Choiromyces venosus 120613-1]|uniref:Uncharacterized protein n=1 Tax=Choiromyces venosus 120613-1 TaxID=1336337 RepID=A0A3N4JEE7_9PEZI|nr:hypothetical protein L873DRAFT_1846060 [Choiromyces venosus 120613-1]